MGALHELCSEFFPSLYWPCLSPGSSQAEEVFGKLALVDSDLEDLQALLKEGWREQVVAAVACLFHHQPEQCRALLWGSFDRGGWATPQLAICAMLLDPGDFTELRRRLLLRCPTLSAHLEGTEAMWRHVVHGSAAITDHNMKGMAALVEAYAGLPEGRDWMTRHLPFEDAYWALEVDHWDDGVQITRDWCRHARPILENLKFPVPDWMKAHSFDNLLELWDIPSQAWAVRRLCQGDWRDRMYGFFHAFQKQGHSSLQIQGDKKSLKVFGRGVSGNRLLLDLKGPYYEAIYRRIEFDSRETGIYEFHSERPGLAALQVEFREKGMSVACLSDYQREPYFQISEGNLEDCPAQIWLVGINAKGRLDGGVAGKLAQLAGELLEPSLREELARGERRPGKVFFTEAFELSKLGVRSLAHIITVPKPDIAELCSGLQTILNLAQNRYSSLAMPALGCGAAGFSAHEVAGPLMEILAHYKDQIRITLAMPQEDDRLVFTRAAKAQGLIH